MTSVAPSEFGREGDHGNRTRRDPRVDLVEQFGRLGGEAPDMSAEVMVRDHRPLEVQPEWSGDHAWGLTPGVIDRGGAGGGGRGDHGGKECGDAETGELGCNIGDPVRFVGDVDTVGAVALQVDEAR